MHPSTGQKPISTTGMFHTYPQALFYRFPTDLIALGNIDIGSLSRIRRNFFQPTKQRVRNQLGNPVKRN